ncbi:hypothetical protein [Occallatibacter riparius]|uniref:Alpha-L-arabinofuranosidase n=1 Tax=Occallatibacter riparius TaxID=1002689 RepID=A0A9J7BIM4_9BACT|nr:hypothetical protein [Occallatibacter riparius]UWZ81650.1 hypothetical protein MOP44_13765 [Occallatibacter riparius]
MTVTPASNPVTVAQSLAVKVAVSGSGGTATGSVTLSSGSYTSAATVLSAGSATIQIAAGKLAVGTDTLSASFTPDSAGSSTYNAASGTASVIVNKATPVVTVTPAVSTIVPGRDLSVTVGVSGGTGAPTATGQVTVAVGTYTSSPATLSNGSAALTIPASALSKGSNSISAAFAPDSTGQNIYETATGTGSVMVGVVTPMVTVTPASTTVDTQTPLKVTVTVDGGSSNPTPTGSVVLSSGSYTSGAATLASGKATIDVPAGSLAGGSATLSVAYTPDAGSAANFGAATGSAKVTVSKITPTVTVTPASTSIRSDQDLKVTVAVAAPTGDAMPTGSVVLSSGAYKSSSTVLASGSATIDVPADTFTATSVTLTAAYTPDSASVGIYNSASGTSAAIAVTAVTSVSINQAVSGPKVTDQLLGMNLADWYDPTDPAILPAFKAAGIKAVRWPGGSWSDNYHWEKNMLCYSPTAGAPLQPGGWAHPNGTYDKFINDVEIPGGLDVALTADYGTDATCTKGGDPTEAAAWITFAEKNGGKVSHMTVGNENYGSWETDLHAKPNDPTTYATAVATGFYPDIKAVDKNVPVGVVVNPGNVPDWDTIVLANAKYDFVEYHFYPQGPGQESDTYITQQAAQELTKQVETLKAELKTAGKPDMPIYVGEVGSVYTNPGKQSWSITQGLYAGQALGEMMNEGVSRLTWWIGFGDCNQDDKGKALGNMSSSLYGWQTFGAYNVFSDGPSDGPCGVGSGPAGTMSPTARAFQLFSNVAVNGESVLTPTVAGDITNVRAYAATHSGGTALVLFNLNGTASEDVKITLSAQSSSSDVQVITYSKAIYDTSKNGKWDPPVTKDMGPQSLPVKLTLDPWSMNVVIIK